MIGCQTTASNFAREGLNWMSECLNGKTLEVAAQGGDGVTSCGGVQEMCGCDRDMQWSCNIRWMIDLDDFEGLF